MAALVKAGDQGLPALIVATIVGGALGSPPDKATSLLAFLRREGALHEKDGRYFRA